jgi:hypothetical protein
MANCHSERSEESIGDSSPIGLRMTRWGVAKQSRNIVLGLVIRLCPTEIDKRDTLK